MRRYIYNDTAKSCKQYDFDVVVVGSGIAGLFCALHLNSEYQVAIITKSNIDESNSYLAQGGIAAVISKEDHFISHIQDTLTAGAGLCDENAVQTLVTEGPECIRELIEMQVPFDVNPEGDLLITREGGHHMRRIVHCGGDATGKETTKQLGKISFKKENLHFFMESYMVDILTDGQGVCGVMACVGEEYKVLKTRNLVVATGGIGQIYRYTTNPVGSVGDGIAACARAGAKLNHMEMVQFHPTTLIPDGNPSRLFLISEAVRGEGAILRNIHGEAFMADKHELRDLAPRDIVARAIIKELKRTESDRVFLDCSAMSAEFFEKRFPTIFKQCKSQGINLTSDYIPVRPAQHYQMGGVKTDIYARTNIEGLYCCGECAESGIHGANRLASNSMLECLVFGKRCANYINENFRPCDSGALSFPTENLGEVIHTDAYYAELEEIIKDTMTEYAGPERSFSGMAKGISVLETLEEQLDCAFLNSPFQYKVYNMLQNGLAVLRSAVSRKESVGAHYIIGE